MTTPNYMNVVVGVVNNMTKFMSLPDATRRAALLDNLKEYTPSYYVQDDFTVAVLNRGNGAQFVGVSKRNASDHKNPLRGKSLALARAYKSAVRHFLNTHE